MTDRLEVERLGGFAGFGGGGHLKSRGSVSAKALSAADRDAVDALFARPDDGKPPMPDAFRYRITRQTARGPQSVEVPESRVPAALAGCVKDTLD